MYWVEKENQIQEVQKACKIYPWPSLVGQTGIIKSQILFFGYISFITAFMQCLSQRLCANGIFTNAYDVFL